MKKTLSYTTLYIVTALTILVLPVFAHAAATPTTPQTPVVDVTDITNPALQGKPLTARKNAVQASLQDILTQLTTISNRTQVAVNQLTLNGLDTTKAQTDLLYTNASLTKAKIDIEAFSNVTISPKASPSATLDILKNSANTAENSLADTKKHLIDTLADLKDILPGLDTSIQQ